jgi:hypothetical protein
MNEPALLRSDDSVLAANHTVKREGGENEDHPKSNASPKTHPANSTAQRLECLSMLSRNFQWEPTSLLLLDGRTVDLARQDQATESCRGHVCQERLPEWSHDSPASKQALGERVPEVYLPSFEDGAVATEAVGPQLAFQSDRWATMTSTLSR